MAVSIHVRWGQGNKETKAKGNDELLISLAHYMQPNRTELGQGRLPNLYHLAVILGKAIIGQASIAQFRLRPTRRQADRHHTCSANATQQVWPSRGLPGAWPSLAWISGGTSPPRGPEWQPFITNTDLNVYKFVRVPMNVSKYVLLNECRPKPRT